MSRLKTFLLLDQNSRSSGDVYKGLDIAYARTATRVRFLKTSLDSFEAQSLGLQRLHSAVVLPMNKYTRCLQKQFQQQLYRSGD